MAPTRNCLRYFFPPHLQKSSMGHITYLASPSLAEFKLQMAFQSGSRLAAGSGSNVTVNATTAKQRAGVRDKAHLKRTLSTIVPWQYLAMLADHPCSDALWCRCLSGEPSFSSRIKPFGRLSNHCQQGHLLGCGLRFTFQNCKI